MIDRGFLFHPDFEVRNQIRMIGGMPDLSQFDFIFISCSGGKDSQAMSYLISELAEKQGYSKENIELLYADTGLEWHDTFEHVKKIGEYLGIKAVQVLPKFKLLDNVRRRWMKFNGLDTEQNRTEQWRPPKRKDGSSASPFPNHCQRFCTSDHKRTPIEQHVRSHLKMSCSAEVTENSSQSRIISGIPGGGEIKVNAHSQVNMQDFAQHGESKNQCCNMSGITEKNPFPSQKTRYCTGEGKTNAIKDRVRSKNKEDG